MTVIKIVFSVIGVLALAVLVGPFLVPVRPLQGTVAAEELADPDSRFVDLEGVQTHYKVAGSGEPAIILLHGFASSTFTWREVIEPLSELGTVVAYDRISSGLTERPMPGEWDSRNPYSADAQADQVLALMENLGIEKAILVGNSAGGTIALLTALRYPDRVEALVLVDPAVYNGGGAPGWIKPFLRLPQVDRLGPLVGRLFARLGENLARAAWHDPSKITPEIWEGYRTALRAENRDRGLWELTKASRPLGLARQLSQVRQPTLVITGSDDRIVPTEESIRLASELPNAELIVIPNCGHVPQEECPEAWLQGTTQFIKSLTEDTQDGDAGSASL